MLCGLFFSEMISDPTKSAGLLTYRISINLNEDFDLD